MNQRRVMKLKKIMKKIQKRKNRKSAVMALFLVDKFLELSLYINRL
jgi:hypothetical protein